MNHLIFIDIFPSDTVDDLDKDLKNIVKKVNFLTRLKSIKSKHFLVHKSDNTSVVQWFKISLKYISYILLKIVPMRTLNILHDKLIINENSIKDNYVNLYGFNYKETLNTLCHNIDFDDAIKIQFENSEFYIPKNYHSILSSMYGTYSEYPPVEHRHGNHDFINLKVDSNFSKILK